MQLVVQLAVLLFDVPDALATAAANTEQGDIPAVGLVVVPGDQAQQGGLLQPLGPETQQ